ncbi:MAG: NAD-dependent epimerase/dehydratase family protein [Bacteroidota bacterium]
MKVLVTGAGGFVGNNVVRVLLKDGYSVRAMVYQAPNALEGLDIEVVKGDILNPDSVKAALQGMDAVVHTAGRISIDGDPDGMVMKTNVDGVRHMVEASLEIGIKRFVHFSSIQAFEDDGRSVLNEKSPPTGKNSFKYDLSKLGGELEVKKGVANGLSAIILNPPAIYGPYDFEPSLTGQMLLDFYYQKIPMLTPGGFNFTDVRDIAQAAVNGLTMGRSGENYILGNRWISVGEMARLTEQVTGVPSPKRTSPLFLAYIGLPFIKLSSKLSGKPPVYTKQSLDTLKLGKQIDDSKAVTEIGLQKRDALETIRDAYAWFGEVGMLS